LGGRTLAGAAAERRRDDTLLRVPLGRVAAPFALEIEIEFI
jgi:hypothetical protein